MTDLNRRFAKLCGWIKCECCDQYYTEGNSVGTTPDFISDPRLVLREMKDWKRFVADIGAKMSTCVFLNDYILDTTEGLLVKAAIEWMEKEQ